MAVEDAMQKENTSRLDSVRLSSEWYDLIICLLLAGMSAWFLVKSRELGAETDTGTINAATFPVTIAVILIISVIILALPSMKRLLQHNPAKPITFRQPVSVALSIVLFAVFPIAMKTFGYYPAATVWLLFFGLAAGVRKPLQLGGLIIGFLLFAWAVFEKFLGTPL